MKIQVTIKAILDTERISDKGVKNAIEKSAFNQIKNNIAELWAVDEIYKQGISKQITLELK